MIAPGSVITIGNLGYFLLERIAGGRVQIVVQNLGYPENEPPGSIAPAGSIIMQAGARGAMGVEGIPGEPGAPDVPGPWVAFEPDPGWTDSTLRHRLIFNRRSVEFDGQISGPIAVGSQAQIGVLEPAFRPVAAKRFVVAVNTGLTVGLATLEILANGQVLVRPERAMDFVTLGVTYPLD